MASEERSAADSLIAALEEDPSVAVQQTVLKDGTRFNFFAAVALLERLTPSTPRVGGLGPAVEEGIRFRHDPSLIFSTSDISAVELKKKLSDPTNELSPRREVYEVTTAFMGLTGAATPLPSYFAEEVAHEDQDAPAMRDFLDLFHHRLLSLLYRWHCKYDYSREFLSDITDAWSKRLMALCGVDIYEGPAAFKHLPMWRILRLAPLLSQRARTGRALELALEDTFSEVLGGARINCKQFQGRWVEIEIPQRWKLGLANSNLGENTVVGAKIYDRGGKFRLVVGPLKQDAFRRFLPGGDMIPKVREVVGLFTRDQLDYDLELILEKPEPFKLTYEGTARLGLDTWLEGRSRDETRVIVDVPYEGPRGADTPSDSTNSEASDSDSSNGGAGSRPDPAFDRAKSTDARDLDFVQMQSGEGHNAR